MGLLSNLMSKIFSHSTVATVTTGGASAAPAAPASPASAQPAAAPAAAPPTAAPAGPAKVVDVAAILDGLAAKNPEKLDWKKSIVDLMKLVGMDSSFKARKQLAQELKYTGDPNDSASMNVWLHKQVLIKISENGGKVPEELLR
jgi:pyruvate/2-oxoglutarate dehydrogenase complex dihydrolipoamide acyltransferase (E2) component